MFAKWISRMFWVTIITGWICVFAAIAYTEATTEPYSYAGEGYKAGMQGLPPESCPYTETWNSPPHAREWKKGWQRGYLDRQHSSK